MNVLRRRRVYITVAALILVMAGVLAVAGRLSLAAGHGPHATALPHFSSARAALADRLQRRGLAPVWIACVPVHIPYKDTSLSRCNVNFGEPHLVPYCVAVFAHGYTTDRDTRAVNCGARVRYDEKDLSVYVR